MKNPVVSISELNNIIAYLKWISRDTLDRDGYLDEEEYLETARNILDQFGADYNKAEIKFLEQLQRKD